MKLSQRHQKTFDEAYPNGYELVRTNKKGTVIDESGYFHIMYIDIFKDGERTRDVPCVQKYSVDDWEKTKRVFEIQSIKVTGHKEYAVIHDPVEAEKVKAEAKAKEAAEKKAKAEEAKKKAEAMRVAKAEKAKAARGAAANVKPEPS